MMSEGVALPFPWHFGYNVRWRQRGSGEAGLC